MSELNGPGASDGARPSRVIARLDRALKILIALAVFSMAALTFVDVIGRYFFNAPIPGTFESVGLLLGVVAFATFPLVTTQESHITVDLFDNFIRGRVRRWRHIAVRLGTAAMAGFMAERLWAAAIDEWANDYVTEYFGITRAPLLILMAAFCAATAIAMLVLTWRGKNRRIETYGSSGETVFTPGEVQAQRRESQTEAKPENDQC
jgi:TRAP-type transport system small permease protein